MMDITKIFKATIKTVRMRKKFLTEKEKEDCTVLRSGNLAKKSTFQTRTNDVCKNISKLREFLIQHRHDYIGELSYIGGDINGMTDEERNQIDNDAQFFMRKCSTSINDLNAEASTEKKDSQLGVHRKAVIQLLRDYLKEVCKVYSQQKAIRVKRAVDRKKLSRLNPQHTEQTTKRPADILNQMRKEKSELTTKEVVNATVPEIPENRDEEIIENYTKEEIQLFEQENEVLLNEMNNIVDEVRQIEGKVVEISQLQEIFADKVLDQANQIDKTHETAVTTTDNIKDGNENIREAIKNSATFRVWILFFLVMCTFSLLFLDWYNQ